MEKERIGSEKEETVKIKEEFGGHIID